MMTTRLWILSALLVLATTACTNAADDASARESKQGQVSSAIDSAVCESRATDCETRAESNYDACLYSADLTYDSCVRHNGENCDSNYDAAYDACYDKYSADNNQCNRSFCVCQGFTLQECTQANG